MSKNKNKNKNVTSIAIKLNAINVRDMFFKFLVLDLLLIGVLGALWCIDAEKIFYGSFIENAKRSLEVYPIETARYTVIWENGKTMVKDMAPFLDTLIQIMSILGILEGIFLLEEIIFGTAKIRKSLKPLNDIAETASRLSNIAFDDEKFQNLEAAISKLSPVGSDERITIGDSELQGLEDAINKLLDCW